MAIPCLIIEKSGSMGAVKVTKILKSKTTIFTYFNIDQYVNGRRNESIRILILNNISLTEKHLKCLNPKKHISIWDSGLDRSMTFHSNANGPNAIISKSLPNESYYDETLLHICDVTCIEPKVPLLTPYLIKSHGVNNITIKGMSIPDSTTLILEIALWHASISERLQIYGRNIGVL